MKTLKLILTAFLFFISIPTFSQTEAITWQSKIIKNLRDSEETTYICSFRIYPNDKVQWIQGGGDLDTEFKLVSTDGKLPDKGIGQVVYHITKEGYDGTITIQRTESKEIILTLDLSTISSLSAYYQFSVIRK
jgi:hypothetical protein